MCSVLGMSPLACCTVKNMLVFLLCDLAAHLSCSHQPLLASLCSCSHTCVERSASAVLLPAGFFGRVARERVGFPSEQASTAGGGEQGRDGDRVDEALSSVSACRAA